MLGSERIFAALMVSGGGLIRRYRKLNTECILGCVQTYERVLDAPMVLGNLDGLSL